MNVLRTDEVRGVLKRKRETDRVNDNENDHDDGDGDAKKKPKTTTTNTINQNQHQYRQKKRILRQAAGKVWEDKTLEEWPKNDYRFFVGDLGPEVTTQTLETAFGKYASFQRALVVSEKVTGKSRGFGFVSFLNADDYTRAFREYDNKYIGSRPVKLRKSTWQDRNITTSSNHGNSHSHHHHHRQRR
jgi:RNA recognition motif-containing protein